MLSKLKYSGVSKEDLIEIYCLFIRSRAEYCSVAFGSSLSQEQANKIPNIEKTSLRIILQEMYVGYLPACEMSSIIPISERRQQRMLDFAKKCIKHATHARFFPTNKNLNVEPSKRQREPFKVNFARTETYKKSEISTCQRLLNDFYMDHQEQLCGGSGLDCKGEQQGGGGRSQGKEQEKEKEQEEQENVIGSNLHLCELID